MSNQKWNDSDSIKAHHITKKKPFPFFSQFLEILSFAVFLFGFYVVLHKKGRVRFYVRTTEKERKRQRHKLKRSAEKKVSQK